MRILLLKCSPRLKAPVSAWPTVHQPFQGTPHNRCNCCSLSGHLHPGRLKICWDCYRGNYFHAIELTFYCWDSKRKGIKNHKNTNRILCFRITEPGSEQGSRGLPITRSRVHGPQNTQAHSRRMDPASPLSFYVESLPQPFGSWLNASGVKVPREERAL